MVITGQANLEKLWENARLMIEFRNFKEAKKLLQKIIRIEPKSWVANMYLGHALYQLDDFDKALHYAMVAKDLPGLDPHQTAETEKLIRGIMVYNLYSEMEEAIRSDETQVATEKCLLLLELDPLDEYANNQIAFCYEMVEDYTSVVDYLDRYLESAVSIEQPCEIHWKLFLAKKELDRLEDAQVHHDYLVEHAIENIFISLRYEMAEYAFRKQEFNVAQRLIDEYKRFLVAADIPINEKNEFEVKIFKARLGIFEALGDEESAKQMSIQYLEELRDGYREYNYWCLFSMLINALDRKDFNLIDEVLGGGWLQQDELEEIIPSSIFFKAILAESADDKQNALRYYRTFKRESKRQCELKDIDFLGMWEDLSKSDTEYGDFAIPERHPPLAIYVDEKIEFLKSRGNV